MQLTRGTAFNVAMNQRAQNAWKIAMMVKPTRLSHALALKPSPVGARNKVAPCPAGQPVSRETPPTFVMEHAPMTAIYIQDGCTVDHIPATDLPLGAVIVLGALGDQRS